MVVGATTPAVLQATVSLEGTEALGRALAADFRTGDVVLLEGDLGAGKTTLTGAILRGLGLDEDAPVQSPTFALVHDYALHVPVLHVDLYRIESDAAVLGLDLHERSEGALLLVEWGEKHRAALPPVTGVIRLAFDAAAPDVRRVTVRLESPSDGRFSALPSLLAALGGVE